MTQSEHRPALPGVASYAELEGDSWEAELGGAQFRQHMPNSAGVRPPWGCRFLSAMAEVYMHNGTDPPTRPPSITQS
jgi:hypothetical protein